MNKVVLKPELRTQGGETVSIYLNEDWAGDLYLVYREGEILTGTIQIDTQKVSENQLDVVEEEVRTYIEHLNSALGVQDSSVVMMYGDISSVVEMEPFDASVEIEEEDLLMADDEDETIYMEEEDDFEAYDAEEDFEGGYAAAYVTDDDEYGEDEHHLSVVYENGEHTKYHLHDADHATIGVVAVDEIGNNVSGRVEFWKEPSEDETSDVARMLARTFNDSPKLSFTMNYEDQHIGDMHMEHQDLY